MRTNTQRFESICLVTIAAVLCAAMVAFPLILVSVKS